MRLKPFIMFSIIVLKTLHTTLNKVKPSNIDTLPTLLLSKLRQKSSLDIFKH